MNHRGGNLSTSPKQPPPRVLATDGSIPLDFALRLHMGNRRNGAILIRGGPGSDLTAASELLCHEFRGRPGVRVSDEHLSNPDLLFHLKGWAIDVGCPLAGRIYTATFDLAPWSTDEIIEYVLAEFPQKAKSILGRIMPAPDPSLEGNPRVWRTAIEVLANLDRITSPSDALDEFLRVRIGDRPGVEDEALFHLQTGARHGTWPRWTDQHLGGLKQSDVELLKCPPVLARLALNSVIRVFSDSRLASDTNLNLPARLARAAGRQAAVNPEWRARIIASLRYPNSHSARAAGSILTYSGVWWPPPAAPQDFARSHLIGLTWPGRDLRGFAFTGANLAAANLEQANLDSVVLREAMLEQAQLRGAVLSRAKLNRANLDQACLEEVAGQIARLNHASLVGANLDRSDFFGADLTMTDLTQASLKAATFNAVDFRETIFSDADASGARFCRATFWKVDLSETRLDGASFRDAVFHNCRFEGLQARAVEAFAARFKQCDFTSSELREPDFRAAGFEACGLAEISWIGADLREASFRNCSFHAGSSRSGLVGSPLASEGTRTGFYTDEAAEQGFKSPDEIRKADLRGADLRGADLGGLDLYLVDLRGAKLDPATRDWARRCGAILHARR